MESDTTTNQTEPAAEAPAIVFQPMNRGRRKLARQIGVLAYAAELKPGATEADVAKLYENLTAEEQAEDVLKLCWLRILPDEDLKPGGQIQRRIEDGTWQERFDEWADWADEAALMKAWHSENGR